MKTVLKSNFRDIYDHWFSSEQDASANYIFKRNTYSGPTREDMFSWMSFMNLSVPKTGTFESLMKESSNFYFVVYLDQISHQGEGKFLLSRKEFFLGEKYTSFFASEYIGLPNGKPRSFRYLSFGERVFWLSYTSNDFWRSNCGDDIQIEMLDSSEPRFQEIQKKIQEKNKHIPLLAIDFVEDSEGKLFGIDLNIAPQIGGTGIENLVKPKEIAEEIQRFMLLS
jgi:hypothetical protein